MDETKRVLCVGLLCLDNINIVNGFPEEDTDERCLDSVWQRGGNASNSCTVLSILGQEVEYMGVVTDGVVQTFLADDMVKFGIHCDNVIYKPGYSTPCSTVISNRMSGLRTILAGKRNLPDLSFEDFKEKRLDFRRYKWMHFEVDLNKTRKLIGYHTLYDNPVPKYVQIYKYCIGKVDADLHSDFTDPFLDLQGRRNEAEIEKMLGLIDQYNSDVATAPENRITTSVELEKSRINLLRLLDKADVVFISKEFAMWQGYCDMISTANGFIQVCKPGAIVICPWGELGAAAKTTHSPVVISRAYPPHKLTDTLAAGDTFNAAAICALSEGRSLQEALVFGCKVAGVKCGMSGWEGMQEALTIIRTQHSQ